MGATDGVTPLNAENVIHKQSADTKVGKLAIVNGGSSNKGIDIYDSALSIISTSGTFTIDNYIGTGLRMRCAVDMAFQKVGTTLPAYIYENIQYPFRISDVNVASYSFTAYESTNVSAVAYYSNANYFESASRGGMVIFTVQSTTGYNPVYHGYLTITT